MIRLLLLAFLSIVFEGVAFAESGPVFSDTGPDPEASYGASKGYPVPPYEYPPGSRQDFLIGSIVISINCTRCAPFKNQRRNRF
jgi:hypothetical protein